MKDKPSDFTNHPFSSVLQKTEAEVIARNIMTILKRTGDTFRPLTWDEYKSEREKDGHFTESEKSYFVQVIDFCKSGDTAILFSESWKH